MLHRPQDIVNAFAQHFCSVYDAPYNSQDLVDMNDSDSSIINIARITETDVIKASKKLSNKFTAGLDEVPSFLVKDCIGVLSAPLTHIFNLSASSGTFPSVWKRSKIIPVFKKGDKSVVANYRPISILSNFSKIYEIILYNSIFPALKNQIKPNQHGFMPKRSTKTNLICFFEHVLQTLDESGQVDVIYTDFQKAFDKIDHNILLNKLRSKFGFAPKLIDLIKSYLADRMCIVQVENCCSIEFCALSGIPQGSNLGPLLFLLFINDIVDIIDVPVLLFADDLKIYLRILGLNDCIRLQSALDQLSMWCAGNILSLNISKCYVMTCTKKKTMIEYDYRISNSVQDFM